ncbi:FAM50-like protein [Trichoderma ghanense]|uniref:FAM50-like protein n=1 Tax=Trichoderma ghanense TaxID=65468 RepID=A0ABY2H951_9HYPO
MDLYEDMRLWDWRKESFITYYKMGSSVDTSIHSAPSGAAAQLAARHADEQPLKLYAGWFCPFVQRAWITLEEKKIPYQYIEINPYKKEPDFLKLNPRGLVPTLGVPVDAAGTQQKPLFESSVIIEYLDEAYADEADHGPRLLPADAYQRARARLWIDHINSRIIPAFYRFLQHTPEKDYSIDEARGELHKHIKTLVAEMDPEGPWFLGKDISLVDISLAPWAKRLFLIDYYKPGGLQIPDEGGEDSAWTRWSAWMKAVEGRASVTDTWSDEDKYIDVYKRYAEDTTNSQVGQATRKGTKLPIASSRNSSMTRSLTLPPPIHHPTAAMSNQQASRFTPQNKTTNERLSTNTVGLVALSDFRKRRAEVLEQQEREAREVALSGTSRPPDRSQTGTPDNAGSDSAGGSSSAPAGPLKKKAKKKAKQNPGKKLLSFGDDDEDGGESVETVSASAASTEPSSDRDGTPAGEKKAKIKANAAVGLIPKAVTKAALRKEAAEREALRREFVALQEAVKATEIAIPFVFYDGANIPGGTVRMRKGDFVWVFLDKGRKVGAELGVGEQTNAQRAWARAGVDDLMLVRGTVIIPHHYDFYYFIVNKTTGPGGKRLFDYSAEAPIRPSSTDDSDGTSGGGVLVTPAERAAAAKARQPDISTLEGYNEDPTLTKVVDRRWYERHKHIYPASTWQEFDPEMDYSTQIRKDNGGNTFFFAK